MPTESKGPTLTSVTRVGRGVVKYGLISLVVLMVGRIVVNSAINYWKATHPEPPPPPTVGFGVLPILNFPEQFEEDKPQSYRQEIAGSRIPDFGDRAKVFLMTKSSASLLADEEAKAIASKYGYVFEPEVVDDRTYRWTKTRPLNSTLEMNIFNHSFTITTDYLTRTDLLVNNELPTDFAAVQQVKSFLDSTALLPEDVATASGEITPLVSLGGQIDKAVSVSDADYLQVDLVRTMIDSQIRMYTPEGLKGTISAILAGKLSSSDAIVHMEFNHHPVDYSQVHTYPLRSVESAWQILQAGEAFIVDKGTNDQAVIRNVSIGYFDDFEEQDYLQPIYVFTGDGDFMAFVSALDPKYIQTTP